VISVTHVSKSFGTTPVLADVTLEVAPSEVVALLGPSGCGKTTLLRILAGLERPDCGEVHLAGALMASRTSHIPPEKRNIGLVFQDFALFPHLTVQDNVAFGLAHLSRPSRPAIVDEALSRFDLTAFARRYPHELSGGQQQRVALARALAPEPRVLLMDEPFSNLDTSLRRRLRVELRQTLRHIGIATIFVTHDQDEALSLADRVAVLDGGLIAQFARPDVVYRHPASLAVARATGQVVTLPGRAASGQVDTALGPMSGHGPDGEVLVILRPEQLTLTDSGPLATVTGRDYTGADVELWVDLAGHSLAVRLPVLDPTAPLPEPGQSVHLATRGPVTWVTHR